MTLKVWRTGTGILLAECSECTSRGSTHLVPTITQAPDVDKAMSDHRIAMADLTQRHQAAAQRIIDMVRSKAITKKEGENQLRSLAGDSIGQIMLAEKSLPDPSEGMTETVASCPWCGKGEPVQIERLSDGVNEPPSWNKEAPR